MTAENGGTEAVSDFHNLGRSLGGGGVGYGTHLDQETLPGEEGGNSDNEEDDMPDYNSLAALLAKQTQGKPTVDAFIPKRGEKDFEPTGFTGQSKAVQRSRAIMYQALSGSRLISTKQLSHAVLNLHTKRAILRVSKGSSIASAGVSVKVPASRPADGGDRDNLDGAQTSTRTRTETQLLPEEILYFMERGALECSVEIGQNSGLVPLSLQHAFAVLLSENGCQREHYQVYCYLRRLGYIVQRSQVTREIRAARRAQGAQGSAVANSTYQYISGLPRALMVYITQSLMRYTKGMLGMPSYLMHTCSHQIRHLRSWLGLRNLPRPDSYDRVYRQLQFIPTTDATPPIKAGRSVATQESLEPHFFAWRPMTTFKKSDPPSPEFAISVWAAGNSHMPTLEQFRHAFWSVSQDLPAKASAVQASNGRWLAGPVKPTNAFSALLRRTRSFLLGGIQTSVAPARPAKARAWNPYPALKSGKTNFVLAVVDEGTTTLLRFGDSDFHEWKLAGKS